MTRYARSDKGTHRQPQPATPWSQMVQKNQGEPSSMRKKDERTKQKVHRVLPKSKQVHKATEADSGGADYRRSKKKKKIPQWKKTEWEMIQTAEEETQGVVASLLKEDQDSNNPRKFKPKKKIDKQEKSIEERLKAIQGMCEDSINEETTDQRSKEERREQRRLKRMEERNSSKTCFNCRQTGHDIHNCPKAAGDMEQGTGICFRCGSTEHSVHNCRVKLPLGAGEFPYAKCFICKELGHLSKQCPENPRGLYPKGGCCRTCGSVEHYNKDCPEKQQQKEVDEMKLSVLDISQSADDDGLLIGQKKTSQVKKKPKVVKF